MEHQKSQRYKQISRLDQLRRGKIVTITTTVFMVAMGITLGSKAGELTTSQQLEMYRNCRKTYQGYNLYFAKKMCGCTVQAYIRDIPAKEAGITCYKYAKTN